MTARGALRLWGAPVALAIVTAVGLLSALLGDGAWDGLSWLTLAAPLAVICWCVAAGRSEDG